MKATDPCQIMLVGVIRDIREKTYDGGSNISFVLHRQRNITRNNQTQEFTEKYVCNYYYDNYKDLIVEGNKVMIIGELRQSEKLFYSITVSTMYLLEGAVKEKVPASKPAAQSAPGALTNVTW